MYAEVCRPLSCVGFLETRVFEHFSAQLWAKHDLVCRP